MNSTQIFKISIIDGNIDCSDGRDEHHCLADPEVTSNEWLTIAIVSAIIIALLLIIIAIVVYLLRKRQMRHRNG